MIIFRQIDKQEGIKAVHFYQRLRDLREDKDLTQKQIAMLLKTTAQQYSLWERGEREIPFHHAITLANYYDVSLDYLAERTNKKECYWKKINWSKPPKQIPTTRKETKK